MLKQPMKAVVAVLAALAFYSNFQPVALAQNSATDTYAITNARLVPVSGPVIERGTIVVRNGLIQAIGENVAVPADARTIDGSGMTVYPGFIDSYTTLGMPQPQAAATPGPGGRGQGAGAVMQTTAFASPNSTQPPGLQPEILVSDQLRPGGEQVESARSAGFASALAVPRDGIFMGQSALINLAGDTAQQMFVESPIALHVGFTPLRTGGYPNSLLGVFSALRQMLIDAQRYSDAIQIYDKNPRGLRRPQPDKSLEALQPAIARHMPVVFYANSEREIRRALDLAQEFNLRAIIAGGEESWKVADRLREQNVPVLLSFNLPKRTTTDSPEADKETMRVLRSRIEAPKTAGKLAAARVRFAFQSGGIANMDDLWANFSRAVEGGLSREEAIRALTLNPAQIFGVDQRLGSLETGKIANLTVVRGDVFEKKPRIAYVFIDGRPVDLKPAVPAQPIGANVSGAWNLSVNLGEGDIAVTLNLQQQEQTLAGAIQGTLGSNSIANASIGTNGEIRFTVPITLQGESKQATEANFTGTVTGNEMKGTVQVVGRAPGTFSGSKPRR
jgi:imidazolonepropionase-like amidohydrolase